MIFSRPIRFTYAGLPALLCVARSNGCCWAEVCTDTGERLSVSTLVDHYERTDEDAVQAFIAAAQDPSCVDSSFIELVFTAALSP